METREQPIDRNKADALWQRVRESLPLSFGAMACREASIVLCCQELYRLGLHRPLMSRLYRQARERYRQLSAMARLEGEPDFAAPGNREEGNLPRLQRLLGLAAADYKTPHPVYGQVLEAFCRECTAAQRALLRLS